jgi:rRNA maturation RNase YbeY
VNEAYAAPLSIENDHPSRQLDEATLRALIRHVLDAEGATLVHLSLVLTNHEMVRRFNESYLDHAYNTDVLSFSLRGPDPASESAQGDDSDADADGPVVEGEVYVDLDTAAERHEEFDTSFEQEAYRYVVHGVLHLIGYDDATETEQATMHEKEDQYLSAMLDDSSSRS